jgi:hypothetical protein
MWLDALRQFGGVHRAEPGVRTGDGRVGRVMSTAVEPSCDMTGGACGGTQATTGTTKGWESNSVPDDHPAA